MPETQDALNNRIKRAFIRFATGGLMLLAGLCTLVWCEQFMEDSLEREIIAAGALLLAVLGGLLALTGYLTFLWHRLQQFRQRY